MMCSLATKVTEESIKAINALEKDLGKTLLAFQCHDLKPSELSAQELEKIRKIETELGVALVAVDA